MKNAKSLDKEKRMIEIDKIFKDLESGMLIDFYVSRKEMRNYKKWKESRNAP